MRGCTEVADRAPMRNRTADLLLTMETLCLLSYRGRWTPADGSCRPTKIHSAQEGARIALPGRAEVTGG
jgi:hypothetical protein